MEQHGTCGQWRDSSRRGQRAHPARRFRPGAGGRAGGAVGGQPLPGRGHPGRCQCGESRQRSAEPEQWRVCSGAGAGRCVHRGAHRHIFAHLREQPRAGGIARHHHRLCERQQFSGARRTGGCVCGERGVHRRHRRLAEKRGVCGRGRPSGGQQRQSGDGQQRGRAQPGARWRHGGLSGHGERGESGQRRVQPKRAGRRKDPDLPGHARPECGVQPWDGRAIDRWGQRGDRSHQYGERAAGLQRVISESAGLLWLQRWDVLAGAGGQRHALQPHGKQL